MHFSGSATIGTDVPTNFWRKVCSAVGCLAVLACGSSEPDSPLILGGEGKDVLPGPYPLTKSQSRALRSTITSVGEACDSVEQAYLRDADDTIGTESWDVRCRDGTYSVRIAVDGTPAVRRCFTRDNTLPCVDPYARRPFYGSRRIEPSPPGELNPELGKLLEEMNKKAEKSD